MKKYEYKAHPLMMWTYSKPLLFVLLIPLFRAVVQQAFNQKISNIFVNEVIIFAALTFIITQKKKNFRFKHDEWFIYIKSGLFLARQATIEKSRISSVEFVRYPVDYLCGSALLRVNTEAGRVSKADFEFRLSKKAAVEVFRNIVPTEKRVVLKFSAIRVAIMAATTSSALAGMLVSVPLLNRAGNLFGVAMDEMFLQQINNVSNHYSRYIPPIVNAVTLVFLSFYVIAFLYSINAFANFRLSVGAQRFEVSSGLLTRRRIKFKTQDVNDVCIEQTPLMRFFRRYLMRVEIGGYGDGKAQKAVLVPCAKKQEAKLYFRMFFPDIKTGVRRISPPQDQENRFYFVPTVFALCIISAAVVLGTAFTVFSDLILFLSVVALLVILYYYNLAHYNAYKSEIVVSDIIYARYSRWTHLRQLYCRAEKIGIITLTKYPTDLRRGTCNIRLVVRSEGADSITVKHIPYEEIRQQILQQYKINE